MLKHSSGSAENFPHGGFIPSIEGMRALAVLAVLLFHLDLLAIAGGYLGVDHFFVISGFISTRNILSDLGKGKFSLKEFYLRRFRRLFPALVVTVLLTLAVGIMVMPPLELMNTASSAIFALFSLANFNFWLESGYFEATADAKPLLHMWSLSVEEQFYLIWPTLLLIAVNSRQRVILAFILLLLSFGSSLVWQNSIPNDIFYLLPFRLHQLMAGALIAILSLRLQGAWGNLGMLLASVAFVNISMKLSGDYSPALGAAAVTGCGFVLLLCRETALARLVYANKLMLWIGQRSYAIYLVHWPIIVLFKFYTNFQLDTAGKILLFIISMMAAIALHELVEKPFRKKGEDITYIQRIAVPATVFTLLVALVFAVTLWHFEGLQFRTNRKIQEIVDSVPLQKNLRNQAIRFGRCNLHQNHTFADYDVTECATPDPNRINVLILGDSMAADTYMMLFQAYPDIQFSQATAGACTAVINIEALGGRYPACEELNAYRFSELVKLDMDLIVLSSIWSEDRIETLKETVEYLHSQKKNVLVIGPRVHFRGSVPMKISQQASLKKINEQLSDMAIRETDLLEKMRAAMPDVEIVDISKIQCPSNCDLIEGGSLLYFDERHLTKSGAEKIGDRFRESFDLERYIRSLASEAH